MATSTTTLARHRRIPFFVWGAHLHNLGSALRCDPPRGACTIRSTHKATVAVGRGGSVKREIRDGGPRRTKAAKHQAAGTARGQLWGAASSAVWDKEETCAFVLPGRRGGEAPEERACRAFVARQRGAARPRGPAQRLGQAQEDFGGRLSP